MKKRGRRILAALTAVLLLAESVSGTGIIADYPGTIYAETQRSAIVNATTLNVRSGPGTGNSVVRKLSYGAPVTVVGQETASDGVLWYKLQFTAGGKSMEGYASSEYIKFPVSYTTDPQFEAYMTSQGFPESYKESLRVLHAEFPSWVFQVQNTGLDWNDAVNNESIVGANLVSTNSLSSWKSTEYGAYDWNTGKWTGFDGPSWVAASRDIVSYYMDPRNFLNEIYVFQFLLQSYDGAHRRGRGFRVWFRVRSWKNPQARETEILHRHRKVRITSRIPGRMEVTGAGLPFLPDRIMALEWTWGAVEIFPRTHRPETPPRARPREWEARSRM